MTIFLEYGALSHARKTRVGAPLRTSNLKRRAKAIDLMQQKPYAMMRSIFSTKKNLLGISNGEEALINTLWLLIHCILVYEDVESIGKCAREKFSS